MKFRFMLKRPAAWLAPCLAVSAMLSATTDSDAALAKHSNWNRSGAFTTYHEWDVFQSTIGPNAPDVGQFPLTTPAPGAPTPNVFDADYENTGSFLVGGNIYSPAVAVQIDGIVPGYNKGSDFVTTVMLRILTRGSVADLNGIRLTYNNGTTDVSLAAKDTFTTTTPIGQGVQAENSLLFQVPYSPLSMKFDINGSASSMSFGAMSVDAITTRASSGVALPTDMNPQIGFTQAVVPEPTSLALVGLTSIGLLARRRRTQGA